MGTVIHCIRAGKYGTKSRHVLATAIVLIAIFATGCSSGKNEDDLSSLIEDSRNDLLPVLDMNTEESIEYDKALLEEPSNQFELSIFNAEDNSVVPGGAVCFNDNIIVTDKAGDRLVVIDWNNNVIKMIGGTGNAPGEFINPTGIAQYDNSIYVIDSGNQRVQIFDKLLNYVEEISVLSDENASDTYENIAIANDGSIYLCGNSLINRHIDKWSDGKCSHIGKNFYGSLYSKDGQVYSVNRGNICVDPKTEAISVMRGSNYLFKIEDDELVPVCELPKGLVINSFVIEDDTLICTSNNLERIYAFDLEGTLKESIANLKDYDGYLGVRTYITMNDDGSLLLSDGENGRLFYIIKNHDK